MTGYGVTPPTPNDPALDKFRQSADTRAAGDRTHHYGDDCQPPHAIPEYVCEDCMDGDHEECRRQGGWPHQDDDERCGCHLTHHRLDNRERPTP